MCICEQCPGEILYNTAWDTDGEVEDYLGTALTAGCPDPDAVAKWVNGVNTLMELRSEAIKLPRECPYRIVLRRGLP